jgi:dephospho-CoA kinase
VDIYLYLQVRPMLMEQQVLLEVPYLFEVDLVHKVVVVQLLFVH